jgi:hypothetical protein
MFSILQWPPGATGPKGYGRDANADFWASHVADGAGTIVADSPAPVDFFSAVGLK